MSSRRFGRMCAVVLVGVLVGVGTRPAGAAVTREQVENAIRNGVRYLKSQQRPDGSWFDRDNQARTGTTSLVTMALLTAGEGVTSPTMAKAIDYLHNFSPEQLKSTYSVALQTMVFATATPERDQLKIAANVAWLEARRLSLVIAYLGPALGLTTNSRRSRAIIQTLNTLCSA